MANHAELTAENYYLKHQLDEIKSRLEVVEERSLKNRTQYYESLKRIAENFMNIKRTENRMYLAESHIADCTKRRKMSDGKGLT